MTIEVLLFARLREVCGRQQLCIDLADGATVSDCFAQLGERFPELRELRGSVVVAINEDFATWRDCPTDGDTVAFIPPVSGG